MTAETTKGAMNMELTYHYSDEKQELLRISDPLKNHKVTIAAYFADHEDSKERGNFIRSYFDNTFVEKILSNGQRQATVPTMMF